MTQQKSLQELAREILERKPGMATRNVKELMLKMGRAVIAELEQWSKEVEIGPYGFPLPYANSEKSATAALWHLQSLDREDKPEEAK